MIVANRFQGGVNGVWVGSRMGESTLPMECSDPPYVSAGLKSIALDRAARNTILANSFADVTYGVRVEDDGTKVVANRFSGPDATHHAVVIGTPERTTVLGRPVRGTVLVANRRRSPATRTRTAGWRARRTRPSRSTARSAGAPASARAGPCRAARS